MVDVATTAQMLGISEQRVRTLLAKGQLKGQKIGRYWVVSETSIAERRAATPRSGRPARKDHDEAVRALPDVEAAHRLYDECREVLAGCYVSEFLDQARSPQEEEFWVTVADCFLRQRQRELVAKGVF